MNRETPLKLLLVEDNPGDVRLVRAGCDSDKTPMALDVAVRLDDALDKIKKNACDAVLLDLGLPDSQGIDTFIRLHQAAMDLPVVILSGIDDEALAIEAVQRGAQDYLIKGQIPGAMLFRAVRYAIERQELKRKLADAQALVLQAERLRVLAETAGAAAHEINQPLTAVLGYADLLLHSAGTDPVWRESLEEISQAACRIKGIIQKMQAIDEYKTKAYIDDILIVDFDASASKASDPKEKK